MTHRDVFNEKYRGRFVWAGDGIYPSVGSTEWRLSTESVIGLLITRNCTLEELLKMVFEPDINNV